VRIAKFRAEVIEGHKGVVAVLVPFDPEGLWGLRPVRLAGRRHGWPVKGTAGRTRFAGYIGERWGRFFVTLDPAVIKARIGDTLALTLTPTREPKVVAQAIEQSRVTTQPKKARPDAEEVE
jgi:hypothetical protein